MLATRFKIFDMISDRKIHRSLIPRLGGVAIFLSFTVSATTLFLFREIKINFSMITCMEALFLIFLLGILDDLKGLSASKKIPIQVYCALLIYFSGYRIETIILPFWPPFSLGMIAPFFTVLWIVGLSNAINLVDGLDGLAAGISAIGMGMIALFSALLGNQELLILSLMLLGAIFGFLLFNFYPAKIFMGDSGSLFIGFMGAIFSIRLVNESGVPFFVPVIIFLLPITETLFSIFRRFVQGQLLFSADLDHFHHRLIQRGLTHRKSVLLLYGISVLLGITAILMFYGGGLSHFFGVLVLLVGGVYGIFNLGYGTLIQITLKRLNKRF